MATRLQPQFVDRLHRGEVEFKERRFERSTESYGNEMSGFAIESDDRMDVCNNEEYYPAECHPEHIRRILACLHYCYGMSTMDLEKQNALMGTKR